MAAVTGSRGSLTRKRRCRVSTRRQVPPISTLDALRRAGSRSRSAPLGQLQPSRCCSPRRSSRPTTRAARTVCGPASTLIWLRQITIRERRPYVLPGSRWSGPGRGDARDRRRSLSTIETVDQLVGPARPEPDLDAPVRGIVLGDSFMQGMFIGDDDTPPECLRRDLEDRLKTKVSILNTGHLGYSPEQYYYSLVEFADRFRPQFVVVSVFTNDFPATRPPLALKGNGDWDEGKYWLDKIITLCRSRGWTYLVVPVPYEPILLGRRKAGHYPGTVSNILEESSLTFLDPSEDLSTPISSWSSRASESVRGLTGCPLFNVQISDGHFSALGSKAWAADRGPAAHAVVRAKHQRSRRRNADRMISLRGYNAWVSFAPATADATARLRVCRPGRAARPDVQMVDRTGNHRLDRSLSDRPVARPLPVELGGRPGPLAGHAGVGLPPDRGEIDADWKRKRLFDIEQSRGRWRARSPNTPPPRNGCCDTRASTPTMPWCAGETSTGPCSCRRPSSSRTRRAGLIGFGRTCARSGSATFR